MKKTFFTILLLVTLISSIFAYSSNIANNNDIMYLVPMGSSGIDLRSNAYPRRDVDKPGDLTWKESTYVPGPNDNPTYIFYDYNILVIGGVSNYQTKTAIDLSNTFFRFSVFTDTGSMDMVSQSNSSYRRPFELYMNIAQEHGSSISAGSTKKELVKIDSVNMSYDSKYFSGSGSGDRTFFFDIILALPGKFKEDTTVLDVDNKLYMLGEAEDYAAMVTIKAELIGVDNNGSETVLLTKTLTVPFTGYIETEEGYKDESNVSLVVSQEAISSIIDIDKNQNKPFRLATLNFMANLGDYGDLNTYPNDPASYSYFNEHFAIFISSNSNPHIQGNKFRFENVNNTGVYNSYNSVGFTLELVGTNQRAKFYGDEYLSGDTIINSDPSVTPCVLAVNNPYEDSKILHSVYRKESNDSITRNKWYKYYYYEGELIMTLDSIPNVFAAGRYTENIYIHVISDYQKK